MMIHWVRPQNAKTGRTYGFTRCHEQMRAALTRRGVTFSIDAAIALDFTNPAQFIRVPGYVNVVYTMYESELIQQYVDTINTADVLIVPSNYCKDLFRPHTDLPIYVVPLGVNTDVFKPIKREEPVNRPFQWLFHGTHDIRKGWYDVFNVWVKGKTKKFIGRDDCRLYMKTVFDPPGPRAVLEYGNNLTIDSRMISDEALMQLYAQADAFIFPTMSEGFGLTLLEAMATGLPCMTILNRGVTEYASEENCLGLDAYPVSISRETCPSAAHPLPDALRHNGSMFRVNLLDMYQKMNLMMEDSSLRKRLGNAAAQRAQQFTWDMTAARLCDVLNAVKHTGEYNEASVSCVGA
jgi:glycosyltransferase involved in cell wall biosynthesis